MRRNWKRILSLLLTVAMVFTMNTSVFAGTYKVTTGEGEDATIDVVNSQGETISPSDMSDEAKAELKKYSEEQALSDVKALVKNAKSADGLADDEKAVWKAYADANPTGAANLLAGRDEDDSGKITIYAFTNNDATKYFDANGAEVNYNADEPGNYVVAESNGGIEYDKLVKSGEAYLNGEDDVTATASDLAKFMATEKAEEPEESEGATFTSQSEPGEYDAQSAISFAETKWELKKANGSAADPETEYTFENGTLTVSGAGNFVLIAKKDAKAIEVVTSGAAGGLMVSVNEAFSGVAELKTGAQTATLSISNDAILVNKNSAAWEKATTPVANKTYYVAKAGIKATDATVSADGYEDNAAIKFGSSVLAVIGGASDTIGAVGNDGKAWIVSPNAVDTNVTLTVIYGTNDTVSDIKEVVVNRYDESGITAANISVSGNARYDGFNFYLQGAADSNYQGRVVSNNKITKAVSVNDTKEKAVFTVEGLDSLTGYKPSVRKISSNSTFKGDDGVLYLPSEWVEATTEITTTFDADKAIEGVKFTVSSIGLDSAKLWLDKDLSTAYDIVAIVSNNNGAAVDNFDSLPTGYFITDVEDGTAYNDAENAVLGIAGGKLTKGTTYNVYVSVNKAGSAIGSAGWIAVKEPVATFTTVSKYTAEFNSGTFKSKEIPYRTSKALSNYINEKGGLLKVNGSVSQGDADASKYVVFNNNGTEATWKPTITITDANGRSADKAEITDFEDSLYDAIKSQTGLAYSNTTSVSYNLTFDVKNDASNSDNAADASGISASETIKYGKSKVLISVNNVSVNGTDHKITNDEITYRFIANDLEELTSTAETGIKLDMSDASKKAFGAFTLGGALGSTSVVSNNSYTPGHDTIVMNSNCTLVSFNNATGAKDEYAKFAKDDITFEPYTATKSDFYVKPSASDTYVVTPSVESVNVEYGVNSGVAANIEKFFTPEVSVSDNDLKKDDYTVDYVVLSTNEAVSTVSKNWTKYSAETLNFKDFDTGSTLYVYAKVNIKGMSDKDLFMSRKVTVNIVSRKVNLVFNDGGKVNTDVGIYRARSSADQQDSLTVTHWTKSTPTGAYAKVSANFADPGLVKIVPVNDNGFADDLQLKGADIISGNIVFDLSNVDQFTATDGVSANIASFTEPTDAFAKNYEIELAYGFIKVDGTGTYNVQFLAYDNGNVVLNSSYYISGTAETLENAIKASGRYSDTEQADIVKAITAFDTTSLNAVLDNKQTKSNGWKVSIKTESSNVISKNDATVGNVLNYSLESGDNYIFTADIRKYLTDGETGLSIATINDVYYDGRAHEINDDAHDTAAKVTDVNVVIYDEDDYEMTSSEMKEYFTFTFKNNKDASVIFNEDGSFSQFKSEKDRPNVTIKGKGKYTGFNATVYFNILPKTVYGYMLDGLSDGYFIKNGKLSGGLKLNVAYNNYYYDKKTKDEYGLKKTVKLKEYNAKSGKGDYQTILYRKADGNWQRVGVGTVKDVQKLITVSGEYAIQLKGYNNFTGVTERKTDKTYYDYDYRFYVTDDPAYLLDNATINTKTAKYEELITTTKKTISGLDLISAKGVVAKGSKTPLVYGKDYVVSKLEEYKPGIKEWQPVDDVTTTTNAGVFRITIQGVKNGKYFGSKVSKKITVKGKKLNAKDIELVYRTVKDDSKTETAIPKDGIELPETGDIFLYAKNESLLKEGKYEVDNPDANNKGLSKTNYKGIFEPGSHTFRVYGLKEYGGTYVDLKYKMAAIDINNSLISISADKTGIFNAAGGAMPKLTVSFGKDKNKTAVDLLYNEATNGTTDATNKLTNGQVMFDGQTLNFKANGCTLSFTVKVAGNTKLGDQAKITLKGVGNMKGSKKDLTFTVAKKEVSGELPSYYTLTSVNSINYQYGKGNVKYGDVLSFVNDALVGSKDATSPKVDLYQTYFKYDKKNGVVLDAKQVKKNYYAAGATNAGNAVVISAGTLEGFDFKKNAQTDDNFYTYTTKGVIQSVTVSLNQGIDLVTLPGKTDNIIFTGAPYTISTNAYIRVKLNNGTELDPTQFDYSFTDNQAAGNAKLTIVLKNHTGKSTYAYGGATKVFTFKIAPIKNAVKL